MSAKYRFETIPRTMKGSMWISSPPPASAHDVTHTKAWEKVSAAIRRDVQQAPKRVGEIARAMGLMSDRAVKPVEKMRADWTGCFRSGPYMKL